MGQASSDVPSTEAPSYPSSSGSRQRRRRKKSELSRALASNGERIVLYLHVAVVVGSAQALGAVHLVTLLIAATLGLSACVVCYRARLVPRWKVPGPALVLLALAAFSLLQALPLPVELVAKLSPAAAEVWAGALAPFKQGAPRYVSLSLDPGASVVEGLKWLLYAATFTTAAALGASRGPSVGALVVFGSGALVALSSLGHRLLGATRVYGVYEPVGEFAREKLGPLLNPNNLSGYLNAATFCGLGLLIMRRPPLLRWIIGLGVALQLGALLEAASRGGVGGFVLGLLAFGGCLVWARSQGDPGLAERGQVRAIVLGVLAGGALLAALGLAHAGSKALANQNIDKLKLLPWLRPMVGEYWRFGIGRGAFESVFPAYRFGEANVIFTHPENFVAQWVTEWGVPVGLGGLLLLAWTLRPRELGLGREPVAVGVTAALLALLGQNLVDLGLEVPAISIAAATALGACWGGARVRRFRSAERDVERWPVQMAWGLAAVSCVALGLAAWLGRSPVGEERERINAQIEGADLRSAGSREFLRAQLREAMLRHPAEPYFPRLGGYIAWRGRDQNPLPWIDRALERGLTSGRTHYLLARVLATNGNVAQALLEGRFALEYDAELVPRVSELAVSLATSGRQLLSVVPQGQARSRTLEALLKLTERREHASLRHQFVEEALERFPDVTATKAALASDLIGSLEGKRYPELCQGEGRAPCVERASSLASELAKALPSSSQPVELQAQLLIATGRAVEAESLLGRECERFNSNRSCVKLRLAAAARARSAEGIEVAARALIATGCETPAACAESFENLGDEMLASGKARLALRHYERATKEEPSLDRWLKLAKAASSAGAHLQAADALTHALHEKGSDPALEEQIRSERQRGFRQQLSGANPGKDLDK
jgi:tetratricopeptide (TPR) repeat protein